jgi:hypothetical protein
MPAEVARMDPATDIESARLRPAHLNAVLADIGCVLPLVWAFSPWG